MMSRFFILLTALTSSMTIARCLSIADPVNGIASTAKSTTSENKEEQVVDDKA